MKTKWKKPTLASTSIQFPKLQVEIEPDICISFVSKFAHPHSPMKQIYLYSYILFPYTASSITLKELQLPAVHQLLLELGEKVNTTK